VAQTYELEAQRRTVVGKKVGALRREGIVPVVVYGAKLQPMNLQIPYRVLQSTLLHAGGTHIITLKVDGTEQTVVARDVQRDPVKRDILHVDFLAVDKDTRLTTDVPIRFINESPAIAGGNALLITGPSTLKIEALATQIPEAIEVDISVLVNIGDSIVVGDLRLPEGVNIEDSPEEMIVRVALMAAAVEEEEVVEEEVVSAEPEVIKRGKAEEEEEEE
jgi:large subunit ribosomal protein L25